VQKDNPQIFSSRERIKRDIIEKICVFLLLLSTSFSICYWAIAKYDVSTDYRAVGDAESYIKMSNHEYTGVLRRYGYRILVPEMVSFLNRHLNLKPFLDKYYENVDKKIIQLNFGIVNILGLTMTAFVLFYYCVGLNFSRWESLIGSFLFLTSFFVVNHYTTPLVDSVTSFFLIAGFYSVLKGSFIWLGISFLLGVFTKETNFIILLLVLLEERRFFTKKVFACFPGIVLYAIFIFTFKDKFNDNECYFFSNILSFDKMIHYMLSSFQRFNLYCVIENIETFMFLWVLMVYALFKSSKPIFIKRSLWLLTLIFLIPPLSSSGAVGRVVYYLFPIVIPLSLLALRDILEPSQCRKS